MGGIVYIGCTPVLRYIIYSHLFNDSTRNIPIKGIVNLNLEQGSKKANYDSLIDLQMNFKIPIHYCFNVNDEITLSQIKMWNPKLIIQSGWSQKFSNTLLELPKLGCIGEHPSPIPIGRGAATINWAIINGESKWGDSFFKMVEKYDAGPVYAQKQFDITLNDTCKTVYDKVAMSSYNIILANLANWYNEVFEPKIIDENKATYFKGRKPNDGEIDFLWDGQKTYNYIRALTRPYPGAFFKRNGNKIIIWEAKLVHNAYSKKTGSFFCQKDSQSLFVVTGDNKILEVIRLQIENRPEMNGSELMNIL